MKRHWSPCWETAAVRPDRTRNDLSWKSHMSTQCESLLSTSAKKKQQHRFLLLLYFHGEMEDATLVKRVSRQITRKTVYLIVLGIQIK